jgi:DNA-binding NarL/FixJ family response regulator
MMTLHRCTKNGLMIFATQRHKGRKKVIALRKRVDAQSARARKYPASLTERQAEVLRLIAAGKTSREMAEKLVLSERTIQRHIANIYTKIGARNRAEATAFALIELDPAE